MSDAYSEYLNYHFSGDFVLAVQNAIEDSYEATKELTDYLYNLSLDTAEEKEAENIGKWIGYPRPYVPEEFLTDNAFLFFKDADWPVTSVDHGFSSLSNPLTGGRFISLTENAVKLPLNIYTPLLEVIASIKYNGWTLWTLDKMLYLSGVDYEITWDASNDVVVTFDEVIHPIYTFLFETVIDKFALLPRITLTT